MFQAPCQVCHTSPHLILSATHERSWQQHMKLACFLSSTSDLHPLSTLDTNSPTWRPRATAMSWPHRGLLHVLLQQGRGQPASASPQSEASPVLRACAPRTTHRQSRGGPYQPTWLTPQLYWQHCRKSLW